MLKDELKIKTILKDKKKKTNSSQYAKFMTWL
jgi:hypothetical protein